MRAVRVHAFGDPPRIDELSPARPAGPGELAVEVAAAGVGTWDVGVASGRLARFVREPLPLVMGAEFAGRVVEVGAGVDAFTIGDRVIGNPGIVGAWAERVVVAASLCGHAPEAADDIRAAALPVGGLTAWQGLDLLALPAGSSLLVLGAGGSVGSAALQLARARGLRPLAVASASEIEAAQQLGADAAHDYQGDWVEELSDAAGDGVDGVLDLVGGEALIRSAALVRSGARVVTTLSDAADTTLPRDITVAFLRMKSDTSTLDAIAQLVDQGGLTMPVAATHAMDDVASALDEVQSRRKPGKVILTL